MKKKFIYFSAALFSLSAILVSCSDFLSVPVNNQLAVESFYETDEDAEQAILGAYDVLQWHNNIWGSGWSSPYLVRTLPSDESQAGGPDASDQPDYQDLNELKHTSATGPVLGVWGLNYYGIYRCNLTIDNVAEDSDAKKIVLGQAYALRAYYYLDLVSLFGDVPLILKELAPDEYDQPRTAKADVYAQIESDLSNAINLLPLKSAYSASDKFRMSKGTAQTLLGKALLYQGKNAEAATAFGTVISSQEYDLEAEYGQNFVAEGELGTESIFEVVFINTAGYDWGGNGYPWGARAESNIHIQLMGSRDSYFNGGDGNANGWGFNYPSNKLYQAYVAAGDDVRRAATMLTEEEFFAQGGSFNASIDQDGDGVVTDEEKEVIYQYEGLHLNKYGNKISEQGTGSVGPLNYGTNYRLIRYSDVLLLAAEAYNLSNQDDKARTELNKVRTRVGLADVTASGSDLLDAIANERMLELSLEGHRFHDLIRWGKAASEIDGFQTGKHELYPIPQSEILSTPSLTQNPGY